ncbi:hypothetical protein [Ekhidna sp.]
MNNYQNLNNDEVKFKVEMTQELSEEVIADLNDAADKIWKWKSY